jgi:hypothetical protein
MNTVNKSTGYTPFQLRFGKSPRILLPLNIDTTNHGATTEHPPPHALAHQLLNAMQPLELDAMDNLLTAKVEQAHQANKRRDTDFPYQVSERILLSTKNRRQEYKSKDTRRAMKFMPRFDGPYKIVQTNPTHSTVTVNLLNAPHLFPVFHTSEIRPFKENDNDLFSERALHPPEPVTIDGELEYFIDKIVDERK